MINNKQVNLWRGDSTPPTIYHIWIKDDSKLLLYNGTEWKVFLNNSDLVQVIDAVQELQEKVVELGNKTVNSKPIKNNPVLGGEDILLNKSGIFVSAKDSLQSAINTLDSLMVTQIIEE